MEKLLFLTVLLKLFVLKVLADFHFPKPPYCGKSNLTSSSSRILNGNITGLDEYPWMGFVQIHLLFKHEIGRIPVTVGNCTSSLITSNWVLTAAHCVADEYADNYPLLFTQEIFVTLGEWDTNYDPDCVKKNVCAPKSVTLRADKFVHEKYHNPKFSINYDIALLRLERNVDFTPYIQRICLPLEPTCKTLPSYEGRKVIITGWGFYGPGTGGSPIKRKAVVTVVAVDNKLCQEYYGENQLNNKYVLCNGGPEGGVCKGDSGGPLLLQSSNDENTFYQLGVASHGKTPCDNNAVPSVHVRVDAFIDWISETIKENDE